MVSRWKREEVDDIPQMTDVDNTDDEALLGNTPA